MKYSTRLARLHKPIRHVVEAQYAREDVMLSRNYLRQKVTTLDLAEVYRSKVIDFRGSSPISVYLPRGKAIELYYHRSRKTQIRFPNEARGYLYFKQLGGSSMAGEIRIRLVDANGRLTASDLLTRSGTPWRIPLPFIAQSRVHRPFANLLMKQGLVSKEIMRWVKESCKNTRVLRNTNIIFSLDQPFHISFSCQEFSVAVHHRGNLIQAEFFFLFCNHEMDKPIVPYTGSAMVRFEVSDIRSKKTVVLRILEIVKPVEQHVPDSETTVVFPRAGELLSRRFKDDIIPWALDLDEKKRHPLGLFLQSDLNDVPPNRGDSHPVQTEDDNNKTERNIVWRSYYPRIGTLNLDKACLSEVLDYRGLTSPGVCISNTDVILSYTQSELSQIPFPDETRGFLYFKQVGYTPEAGEIRFRLVDSSGCLTMSDLLLPSGIPWRLPLPHIVQSPKLQAFGDLLMKDGLVSRTVIKKVRDLCKARRITRHSNVLFTLDQPFHVSFSSGFTVTLPHQDNLDIVKFRPLFCNRKKGMVVTPYTGSATVRFELSDIRSKKTIVLRILEILKPVEQRVADGETTVAFPRAGKLLSRRLNDNITPWALDLDGKKSHPLGLFLRSDLNDVTPNQSDYQPIQIEDDDEKNIVWRSYYPRIGTLNLDKACLSEVLDYRGLISPSVSISNTDVLLSYTQSESNQIPFPNETRGFLYFKQVGCTPEAGEIRFRLMDSSGCLTMSDLLLPSGIPWRLPLPHIVQSPKLQAFGDLLVKDDLVSRAVMKKVKALCKARRITRHSNVLFTLDQPFHVSFNSGFTVTVPHQGNLVIAKFCSPFCNRRMGIPIKMYTGSATVRFEVSSGRTLVLRILEILKPVEQHVPDGETTVVFPRAGELLSQSFKTGIKPWNFNLDIKKSHPLGLLSP